MYFMQLFWTHDVRVARHPNKLEQFWSLLICPTFHVNREHLNLLRTASDSLHRAQFPFRSLWGWDLGWRAHFEFEEAPVEILRGAVLRVGWFKSQKEEKKKLVLVKMVSWSCILSFVHVIWQLSASPLLLLQENPATFRIFLCYLHICVERLDAKQTSEVKAKDARSSHCSKSIYELIKTGAGSWNGICEPVRRLLTS